MNPELSKMRDHELIKLVGQEVYRGDPDAMAALDLLLYRLASLRNTIDRYGEHDAACDHAKVHGSCTCGFEQALRLAGIAASPVHSNATTRLSPETLAALAATPETRAKEKS